MVERLTGVLAAVLADGAPAHTWIGAHGWGDLAIAVAGFVFLLAICALLLHLWRKVDDLTRAIEDGAQRQRQAAVASQPPAVPTPKRDDEHDRRMQLIDDQLRETSEMVREFLPVLQKIKANQAAALAAQTATLSDLQRPSVKQPSQPLPRLPFEENYNAVFRDSTRDERVPGIKEQFRVNFRDKGSADRNPDASSPLVRDSSGWLSVFVEDGTGTLYLAPSLAFREGTLRSTQVSKLNSLFTFNATPVTRLDRAAIVHRVGEEFHLDQMGSMS